MLELSFNERVRRAVQAYELADNNDGGYNGGVHWCDECGFVPDSRFMGWCGERYHFVDEEHLVECKYGYVDIRFVNKAFVADKMYGLLAEYSENQEEELVEELFAAAQAIVESRVS